MNTLTKNTCFMNNSDFSTAVLCSALTNLFHVPIVVECNLLSLYETKGTTTIRFHFRVIQNRN